MDRYEEMLSRYKTDLDDAQVAAAVEKRIIPIRLLSSPNE